MNGTILWPLGRAQSCIVALGSLVALLCQESGTGEARLKPGDQAGKQTRSAVSIPDGKGEVLLSGKVVDGVATCWFFTNYVARKGIIEGYLVHSNAITVEARMAWYSTVADHMRLRTEAGKTLYPGMFAEIGVARNPPVYRAVLKPGERQVQQFRINIPRYFDVKPNSRYEIWLEVDMRLLASGTNVNRPWAKWSNDNVVLNYSGPLGSYEGDW